MNDDTYESTIDAVITASRRITPDDSDEVRQITLKIEDPSFRYVKGQAIGVVIPGPHPFGNRPHMRRYTIAEDKGLNADGEAQLEILVRRCFYIDEMNGEQYPGIASNFLCDAAPGNKIALSGPYKSPFKMPPKDTDNLLMVGTGTGIAPFRAFIQKIYQDKRSWKGDVRLFFGAKSGMDLLYMNDQNKDIANYYDEATFEAFCGLAEKPLARESDGLEQSINQNAQEIWSLIQQPNTYVYLAGLEDISSVFDEKMSNLAGSEDNWKSMKDNLRQQGRYSELLYS